VTHHEGVAEFESSVSPKGQITVPLEVRRRWGLRVRDRVVVRLDRSTGEVTLGPAASRVRESFGAVPPLGRALTVEQMIELAAAEHAVEAEGRDGS
jgi:bifunctional DNA-binding transcriptional regulator/antitoxin component of YhaV-PrlF toxin-antitoxin module